MHLSEGQTFKESYKNFLIPYSTIHLVDQH